MADANSFEVGIWISAFASVVGFAALWVRMGSRMGRLMQKVDDSAEQNTVDHKQMRDILTVHAKKLDQNERDHSKMKERIARVES